VRYAAVVLAVLVAHWPLMHAFVVGMDAPLLVATVLTERALFGASFAVQRRFVFAGRATNPPREGASSSQRATFDLATTKQAHEAVSSLRHHAARDAQSAALAVVSSGSRRPVAARRASLASSTSRSLSEHP
jgi:hypothetical protein